MWCRFFGLCWISMSGSMWAVYFYCCWYMFAIITWDYGRGFVDRLYLVMYCLGTCILSWFLWWVWSIHGLWGCWIVLCRIFGFYFVTPLNILSSILREKTWFELNLCVVIAGGSLMEPCNSCTAAIIFFIWYYRGQYLVMWKNVLWHFFLYSLLSLYTYSDIYSVKLMVQYIMYQYQACWMLFVVIGFKKLVI